MEADLLLEADLWVDLSVETDLSAETDLLEDGLPAETAFLDGGKSLSGN